MNFLKYNPMKKLKDILFSMTTTVILLIVFAASIGYATFIENSSGTEQAKQLVYNAKWFELLLILLIASLIASIFKYKLINRKKWSVLLFHLAFICILIGSAITRYFGYEGIMHIRQGETVNYISTEKTAVKISAEYNGNKTEKNIEVNFEPSSSNEFSEQLTVGDKTISVENLLFVPNAVESIEASETGKPVVGIFIMSGAEESMDVTLFGDEKQTYGDITFAFENQKDASGIIFSVVNNELFIHSDRIFTKTGTVASGMIDRENAQEIKPGNLCAAEENIVYRIDKMVFMIKGFYPKASKTLTPLGSEVTNEEMSGMAQDALVHFIWRNATGIAFQYYLTKI